MAGLFGTGVGNWFTAPVDQENLPGVTRTQAIGNALQGMGAAMAPLTGRNTPAPVDLRKQAQQNQMNQLRKQQLQMKLNEQKQWQNMLGGAAPAGGGAQGSAPTGPAGGLVSPEELAAIRRASGGIPSVAKSLYMDLLKKKQGMNVERGSVRHLTAEEKAAHGYPPNAIVTRDHTGKDTVVDEMGRPPIGGGAPAAPVAPNPANMSVEDATKFFEEHLPGKFTPEQVKRLQLSHGNPEVQDKIISEIFKSRVQNEDKLRAEMNKKADSARNVIEWGHRANDVLAGLRRGEPYTTQGMEAVYLFMKSLDPESVVRPGEVALASSIASMKAQAIRLFESTVDAGGRLPRESAEQLLQTTLEMSQKIHQSYQRTANEYAEMAKRRGVNPQNVIGSSLKRPGGVAKSNQYEEEARRRGLIP